MRQQQYEQALKEVRAALQEGQRMDMPLWFSGIAIDIINKVLQKRNSVNGSDMSEEDRKASLDRDEANEYSGQ